MLLSLKRCLKSQNGLPWLARDVKTFAKMEKNLGIAVSALNKSKAFLGVINCALFTSLVRNLKNKYTIVKQGNLL